MVLPIAITLFTVPLYISYIGAARYGVLSLVWVLLGYFGFLDFGLARASANALAKLAHGSEERARVLMTSLYINLVLGISGGFILYLVGSPILHELMTLSGELGVEVDNSLPWIAGMLPLALLAGVGTGTLDSHERFFIGNMLHLVGMTLGQILPLVGAVIFGPTLPVVIPAAFVARAISVALILGFVARIERPALFVFDRKRCKELMGFGAWVTVTNVIGPILVSIDRFFIASTLGAKAVAYYSVPMNLIYSEPSNPPSYGEDRFPALLEVGLRRGTRTCRAIRRVSRVRFRSNMRAGHHRRRAIYDMVAWIRIRVTYHASGRASYGWGLDQWYRIHSVFIAARSRAAGHGCKATCPRITSVRYRAMAAAKRFWPAGRSTSLVRPGSD